MIKRSLVAAALAATTATAGAQSKLIRLTSKVLGEERVLHIALPPNYGVAKEKYEVIYLLDGHTKQFFDVTVAAAGYDLIGDLHDYALPHQIVVGIEQKNRSEDLARNGEAFTKYLVTEVVPYIDREYRTNGYRTIIGHSLGGRFAMNTICRAPNVFASVIAMSSAPGDSASFNALTHCLKQDWAANKTRVHQLAFGTGEKESRQLDGIQKLKAYLTANAPSNFRWTVLAGGGLIHIETPYEMIPSGIRFTQDKVVWEMPRASADSIINGKGESERILDEWYKMLSVRLGAKFEPSDKWMRIATEALLGKREYQAAVDAGRRLVAAYPEDLAGYTLLANAYIGSDDRESAKRTLTEGLRMVERLELFDTTEREGRRKLMKAELERLQRGMELTVGALVR
jgi:enterochelin esterase-like enzyme